MKHSILLITAIVSLICSSCGFAPHEMRQKGIVAGCYCSVTEHSEYGVRKMPVSLCVTDLKSDHPSESSSMLGIIKLIPILSLIPIPNRYTNSLYEPGRFPIYDIGNASVRLIHLRSDEIERILVQEIQRSGLVDDIALGGEPKDYDIRGKVNFRLENYGHLSGLGVFYGALIPVILLPGSTKSFKCEAYFEVVSPEDQKVYFAKDYVCKATWLNFPLANTERMWHTFGEEVFPVIVERFLSDLSALDLPARR